MHASRLYVNWVKDIHLFARKLALHKFHKIKNSDIRQISIRESLALNALEDLERESEEELTHLKGPFSSLKSKSIFTPSLSQYSNIKSFVNLVCQDLKKLKPKDQYVLDNLYRREKESLENLSKEHNLVFKPSDKGGNIVVMDCEYDEAIALKLLDYRGTYEILERNPTDGFLTELKMLLLNAKENALISDDEFKFIFNPTQTLATFYVLKYTS